MVDFRAELAAFVAAYDEHGGQWSESDAYELWHAAERARAVLAAEPQIEAPGWCETDAEQYAWQAGWEARDDAMLQPSLPVADGEVVELPPRPPLMEPSAHLALERYGITWDGSPDKPLLTRRADGYWTPWHVAADLLERQPPRPIPVSERLPGPEDCDEKERCWFYTPASSVLYAYWVLREPDSVRRWETHWLPAHALPLPEVNDD